MLVYAEDFASLRKADTYGPRFGGEASMPNTNSSQFAWAERYIPFAVFSCSSTGADPWALLERETIVGGSVVASRTVKYEHYTVGTPFINVGVAPSRNFVFGMLLDLRVNSSIRFDFLAVSGSSAPQWYSNAPLATNFSINIVASQDRQRQAIHFTTASGGYAQIASHTSHYDLSSPTWVWVQCDMTNAADGQGSARVWFNNDLIVSRENIVSGDINSWPAKPGAAFNNLLRIFPQAQSGFNLEIHGLIVLNEGLSYMDSALGDVGLAAFSPSNVDPQQWEPHFGQIASSTDPSALLASNKFLDASAYHSAEHMRASDNAVRDLCSYNVPLPLGTEIVAASHSVSHRKFTIAGDTSKLKVEPVIYTESREPLTSRSYGNLSESNIRALHIPYTIPYQGAFWTDEILHATKFGYAYNDIEKHELVHAEANLLGEYDVENLEDSVSLESEASEAEEA